MKFIAVISVLILVLVLFSSTNAIDEGSLKDVDKIIYYAVPHSHTDAGWYWTYEYYYGLAKRILGSVTNHLHNNPSHKFTWSDHSFFRKWFNEEIRGKSDKEIKVRELIRSGQLDLINGGLVQHDEASSHIKEVYTNFEEGLKFLYDEFGIRPDKYWQLDPFGFSSYTPEILKSLGIDKVVINRMSDAYKNVLRENQDLDFIWQGDGDEEIYTHVLPGHYGTDLAFYYDKRWGASFKCPIPLDEKCAKKLVEESIHQGLKVHNRTGYVMQLLGNDFFFTDAEYSFKYIDGMKEGLEKHGPKYLHGKPVEFRYATLTEYMNDATGANWPIGKYHGDFFVYTQYKESSYDHHWGGYFTSRPLFKWMVRDSLSRERNLHSILATLNFASQTNVANMDNAKLKNTYSTLLAAKEFNPVFLHHDAITGTHGIAVNTDYKRKIQKNHDIMDDATKLLFQSLKTGESITNDKLELIFYNPSLYTRNQILNVSLTNEHWSFSDSSKFKAEIMDSYKLNTDKFEQDKGEFILWIEISIPPLSYTKTVLQSHSTKADCESTSTCISKVETQHLDAPEIDLKLANDFTEVELNKNALEIKSVKNIKEGNKVDINEQLFKYDGKDTQSCIYLFKPKKAAVSISLSNQKYIKYNGKLVSGLQVYGHDADFHFEKAVFLKKNCGALHIVTRNYIILKHDIELTFRYEGFNDNQFYSGNSMAFVHRDYMNLETAIKRNVTRSSCKSEDDTLGLNTYPMVDGFIAQSKSHSYVGFANSQSCASNLISPTSFEFLVARSVMNINGDKGLPERLFEKFMTHFKYTVWVNKNSTQFYDSKNVYVGKYLYIISNRSNDRPNTCTQEHRPSFGSPRY
jgi:hypothetical protein